MSRARWTAVLILLPTTVFAAENAAGVLTVGEREELLGLLEETHAQIIEIFEDTTEAQWIFKPGPDRWSVGECIEHIVRSEAALLESIETALANEPDPDWEEKTAGKAAILRTIMPNRNPGGVGGAKAPQEVHPTGEINREDLRARFDSTRSAIATILADADRLLKRHTEEHPFPIFGWLSAHDWLLYVPLHTVRHGKQIVEVQESDGYPE